MTLRNDLKWDDGTPIKAADFVYTMMQQLSPKYLLQPRPTTIRATTSFTMLKTTLNKVKKAGLTMAI